MHPLCVFNTLGDRIWFFLLTISPICGRQESKHQRWSVFDKTKRENQNSINHPILFITFEQNLARMRILCTILIIVSLFSQLFVLLLAKAKTVVLSIPLNVALNKTAISMIIFLDLFFISWALKFCSIFKNLNLIYIK